MTLFSSLSCDKCLIENLPAVQYGASQSCPDQPGARMLLPLHEWLFQKPHPEA